MLWPMSETAPAALLPPDFLIGVATSGYQVEGGFNGPGEPGNNWVRWEQSGKVTPSGIACDFWRHPAELLDRAASLGCNAFRLSVEWARLEPEEGVLDEEALGRYAEILSMCRRRSMEPVVTLHHFTHPWFLGEEFWLTPGSPDRFAAHVDRVVPKLAAECRYWVTVNEPNVLALMGWVQGAYPPGRRAAFSDAWAVVDNLLTAHVLAYEVVHRHQPEAIVTCNPDASTVYDQDRLLADLLVGRSLGVDRHGLDAWVDERRALHGFAAPPPDLMDHGLRLLFAAASPYGDVGVAGRAGALRRRLRRPCPRRVVEAVYAGPYERPLDAVGFDWYDPVASHGLRFPGHRTAGGERSWGAGRAIWDVEPDPAGLADWCAESHALAPALPLWVVENGMATRVRQGRSFPRVDRATRPDYLRRHLAAVVDALASGIPVGGYFHWSLVDNYEWGSYEPRLGIFGLDRERGDEHGPRWLDLDSGGWDSAGAFRRLVTGLRKGDRSVLDG